MNRVTPSSYILHEAHPQVKVYDRANHLNTAALLIYITHPAFFMDLLNFFSSSFSFFSHLAHCDVTIWCFSSLLRFSSSASLTFKIQISSLLNKKRSIALIYYLF